MAKKKRGMPSKTCVNCGATMHARKAVCPKCGKEQPKAKREKAQPAAARARKPAAAKRRRRAAPRPATGGLPQAVSFVRQVGGLQQAKQLLKQIEEIRKL